MHNILKKSPCINAHSQLMTIETRIVSWYGLPPALYALSKNFKLLLTIDCLSMS